MRYPASEKLEIIRLVEQSHLGVKPTLEKLGIPKTTFYRWYDRYLAFGEAGLEDRNSNPGRVWNRIPDDVRGKIVDLALEEPELSPRELAVRFTDTKGYFVSEASVYRLLKAHVDHVRYLVRLVEMELIDRERRMIERRIRQAKFPTVKSLDAFDFKAIASLNKMLVLELARGEYIERHENVIALGNSGTGKTHIALGLGLAACQKGLSVGFVTAAALVHELMEARDEKRLLRYQKQLARYKLLIIDELGFVPLSKTGAELLFEIFSQRYERGSTLVTSNLPFDEWTEVFGSERLTGALLDRLTHHVHILEMNGDSYRLNESRKRRKSPKSA